MKKIMIVLCLLVLLATGCASKSEEVTVSPIPPQPTGQDAQDDIAHATEVDRPTGDIVNISERLFIAQTNDIYLNVEDYLGKTIRYEGIFKVANWEEMGEVYYYVIRYGPGCCGYDGEAGFEVAWDGGWPVEDDWCEAVGTLETYEMGGWSYLRLRLDSLTVLDERGAEYVAT